LVEGVAPAHGLGDLAPDVRDRLPDALAAIGLAAVAELDRFVDTGRCSRGDRRPAERAGVQLHVDLDGRIAARVENLTGADA